MPEALRIFAPVRAVAVVVAVFSTKATSTTASCGTFTTTDQRSLARYAFIGSTAARGTTTTRSVSAWKKSDVLKAPATSSTSAEPLSRRAVVRRPKSRTRFRSGGSTAADTPPPTQQGAQEPSDKSGGDVGNLLRMEVATRLKEMKLMTQPAVGLLRPGAGLAGSEPAALIAPSLDGDASALEGQIALLTNRIKSIANHLQTSPTDALSRKGLVVLVKQRRSLLEMLQHRDNGRWLATTEALGLRQRADAAAAGEQQMKLAARRTRRRDRGRKRRMDSMDSK